MPRWFPIESNPDVMNSYVAQLGVTQPAVEVVDVYGVTEDMLSMVARPVYAVCLVYPVTSATETFLEQKTNSQVDEVNALTKTTKIFYMKQYVGNACGTIALLHALLNNYDQLGTVAEGSILETLHRTLIDLSPEAAGRAIMVQQPLEETHAAVAQTGATQNQPIDAAINLHFVTFIHAGGRCVELDGRQANPILHGACATRDDFLLAAASAIQERMNLDPTSLEFGITALVGKGG